MTESTDRLFAFMDTNATTAISPTFRTDCQAVDVPLGPAPAINKRFGELVERITESEVA
jgi:hypothetical protein